MIIGFSSPLDNFSGVILSALTPFLLLKRIRISKQKNANKINNIYHVAVYNAGKIKAQQNSTMMLISR
jgi:hypothetical protein